MSLSLPDPQHRWRCGHCGNLTRFDVVRRSLTREFWHVDLAGDAVIDESQVLVDEVEGVCCRWCDKSDRIEVIHRPEPGHEGDSPHDLGGV